MNNSTNNETRLNPVLIATGQQKQYYPEFTLQNVIPLEIVRTFSPDCAGSEGPLGRSDLSSIDIYIRDGEHDDYEFINADGESVRFDKPNPFPGALSINSTEPGLSFEPLEDGGFTVHQSGNRQIFQRFRGRIWRLTAVVDRNGNTITIQRNADGLATKLLLSDQLGLAFHNQEDGLRSGYDLIAEGHAPVPIMRYRYDSDRQLVEADNEFGTTWRFSYDELGNRCYAEDAGKTKTRHIFDEQKRVTQVDTTGHYKEGGLEYHDDRRQVTVHFANPSEGFEKFWFDENQRQFMSSNALGEFSYRKHNSNHELISEIDPNGNEVGYEYDAGGNLQSLKDPEGRKSFNVWDDIGNLLSATTPQGDTTRYEYDAYGNLTEIRAPMAITTNIVNNAQGQPTQIMRHDGLIEFRKYDERHRLTNIIDFNSAETIFQYDDFNRVTGIQDAAKNITWLHYDDIKGKDFNTPSRITRPDGVEIRRDYHPTGTIKTMTDGEGRTTKYVYGPYDVLEEIVDPKGNALKFQYDSQERLTQVTNQLGLHWTFERDLAGRVVREEDFDGRELRYHYDPGGRVIRRDNPDGSHLEYDYDKSGLLTELRAFEPGTDDLAITTYEYDDNGALIKAVNPSATIELARDALGRVVAETTNGVRVESEIDCCGRRTQRRIGGQVVDYTYDGMGGLTKWQLNGHDPVQFQRDKLGQEVQRSNSQGFDMAQSWDAVGQLEEQVGNSIKRAYEWSRGYDPKAIKDGRWGEKRYDYDPNGQITRTRHGSNAEEHFRYNADLNLSGTGTVDDDHDQFLNWQTSAAGVVRIARGPKGEIVKLEHDTNGRVATRIIEQKGFRPKKWTFEWNATDQLIRAHCPDGSTWSYEYDPFGRRTAKISKDAETRFIWDGDVIAVESVYENMRQNEIAWFYEPDSFHPLARETGGDLFYIVNDHLGTPKEMVTETGRMMWAADHDTWGTVRQCRTWKSPEAVEETGYVEVSKGDIGIIGNAALARKTEPDPHLCPIRFQGQWEDEETGLYYNRFRYYEPMAGCYTSLDPIGIFGGERTHSFVVSPNKWTDALGLSGCCICNIGDVGEIHANLLNRGHEIGGKSSSRRVTELAEAMRTNGFDRNSPISTILHEGQYYVVDGHHRLAAAKLAGINPIVKIVDPNDFIRQGGYSSIDDIIGPTPPNNLRQRGKKLPC